MRFLLKSVQTQYRRALVGPTQATKCISKVCQYWRRSLFAIITLLSSTAATAQQPLPDWNSLRSQVLQYHPLARQAELYRDQGRAALLRARGGFDPKLYGAYTGKQYNDQNYFRYTEAGVKWPTWLGLELSGAYYQASGNFLNPESKIPKAGQAAAGFSWNLGQGLLIDERRAALRESQYGIQLLDAERRAALNGLILDAAKAYWDWVLIENQLSVLEAALRQAQLRYAGIVESFRQGDKPAIDTLEAFIQVQNRQLDLNFAQVERQNAALELGNFLWTANELPAGLPAQAEALQVATYPRIEPAAAETLLQTALQQHPDLLSYQAKLQQLEVERRLKVEKRKPELRLDYQLLGNGWQFFPTAGTDGPGVLANDIKWGLRFSYPIPNRKARGDWQLTQIKIAQTDLFLQQKRLEVETKVRQYLNELNTLAGQIALYQGIAANYRALLDAENEKFQFGESSVFLINTREQRWLDAQIKFLKLIGAYRKAEAGLVWATGQGY